jgi:hypothetical protein
MGDEEEVEEGAGVRGLVAQWPQAPARLEEEEETGGGDLAGRGGSSYLDSMIMLDKDANTAWDAASDATLEERRYYCQNSGGGRADVGVLAPVAGQLSVTRGNQIGYAGYRFDPATERYHVRHPCERWKPPVHPIPTVPGLWIPEQGRRCWGSPSACSCRRERFASR